MKSASFCRGATVQGKLREAGARGVTSAHHGCDASHALAAYRNARWASSASGAVSARNTRAPSETG